MMRITPLKSLSILLLAVAATVFAQDISELDPETMAASPRWR